MQNRGVEDIVIVYIDGLNSLLKLLFPGTSNATEKWTMLIQNQTQALSHLDIYFEGRLDQVLILGI